ncbi:hypothetical protein [Cohnella nanjingensis]|uniref:ABC transporter permease n=1 Tax=Cohnella nanjingensis TaxID=1387779 RepID=A0A7X0VJ57_9BACL|nr:hypothetical protein [Cohnella nanjingensis]MBB6674364.1 hypothetical protein [Cohnella nanjingensis]
MWVSALWKREYDQSRLFLLFVPVVHFLALGLQRMNKWFFTDPYFVAGNLRNLKNMTDPIPAAYDFGSFESVGRLWLMLAVFVLALVQIGTERRNGSQELLFSLPYSRKIIFLHKWMLGAALLAGSLLINTFIDMVVVPSSPMSPYFSIVYHLTQLGYSLLLLAAIYTLALFIGTITGSVAFQVILTIVTLMLPIGLGPLITNSLSLHGAIDIAVPSGIGIELQNTLNISRYLTLSYDDFSWLQVLGLFDLLIVAFFCGMLSYARNRTENNGKLVIFRAWERAIRILVVLCASMIIGLFSSSLFNANERLGYDIGFIAGLVVTTFIMLKIAKLRFKV